MSHFKYLGCSHAPIWSTQIEVQRSGQNTDAGALLETLHNPMGVPFLQRMFEWKTEAQESMRGRASGEGARRFHHEIRRFASENDFKCGLDLVDLLSGVESVNPHRWSLPRRAGDPVLPQI